MTQAEIINAVLMERKAQNVKWGTTFQGRSDMFWLAILAEEFGEVANAIIEKDEANITVELVQVAAVVFSWLEFRTPSARQFARHIERGWEGDRE